MPFGSNLKRGIMNITDEMTTLISTLNEFDVCVVQKKVEPPNNIKALLGETMLNILTLVQKPMSEEVPNAAFSMLPDYYKRLTIGAFIEALMNIKGYSIPPPRQPQAPPQS